MKKLILLFAVILVLTSFTNNKTKTTATRYAFVTDTEHDKSFDEYGQNGYVSITTNIVEVNCSLGTNAIELQYIEHYNGQEKSENRQRAFVGASGITNAWIYNTYDEAVASQRDWLSKQTRKHKRNISNFYVTCN